MKMVRKLENEFYSVPDLVQATNGAGILEEILLVPSIWVVSITIPNDSVVMPEGAITLKEGAYWIVVRAAHGSADLLISAEKTEAGRVYVQQLFWEMAKNRPSVAEWFRRYGQMSMLAIVKDRNGYARLLGTQKEPLTVGEERQIFGKRGGKNFSGISLSGITKTPALYLDVVDDAVAYISATADAVMANTLFEAELDGLRDRIEAIESGMQYFEDSYFRLYTYTFVPEMVSDAIMIDRVTGLPIIPVQPVFNAYSKILRLVDGFVPLTDGQTDVLGAWLNGVALNCRIVPNIGTFFDWDDAWILRQPTETRVYFNWNTTTFESDNIFKILVKVKRAGV